MVPVSYTHLDVYKRQVAIIAVGFLLMTPMARALGAEGEVLAYAEAYMGMRLFGAPAVLTLLVVFGILRGQQDMRTPLWLSLIHI